eukprot:RCo006295
MLRRKYVKLDAVDDDEDEAAVGSILSGPGGGRYAALPADVGGPQDGLRGSGGVAGAAVRRVGKPMLIKDLSLDSPLRGYFLEATIDEEVFGLPRVVLVDSQGYSTLLDFSQCSPANGFFRFADLQVGNVVVLTEPHLSRLSGGDQAGILLRDPKTLSVVVKQWTDAERLRCAKQCRARGNLRFTEGQMEACAGLYRTALQHLAQIQGPPCPQVVQDTLISCHLNLASASVHLNDYEEALKHTAVVNELARDPLKLAKAWYRRGQALSALRRLGEAEQCLQKAKEHFPDDPLIAKEQQLLEQRKAREKERKLCARMLKGLSG